jgi:hypothetical protein
MEFLDKYSLLCTLTLVFRINRGQEKEIIVNEDMSGYNKNKKC